mmetsp:Transcript_4426/g.5532  ORF Transcript_4426/g.5532 Transcript_4426/m.5532 type:complete len:80 (+) Transcript_4426:321-560(+)
MGKVPAGFARATPRCLCTTEGQLLLVVRVDQELQKHCQTYCQGQNFGERTWEPHACGKPAKAAGASKSGIAPQKPTGSC